MLWLCFNAVLVVSQCCPAGGGVPAVLWCWSSGGVLVVSQSCPSGVPVVSLVLVVCVFDGVLCSSGPESFQG